MKSRTLIFTLLLFLCVSSFGIAEIAYDNHRQGFIIGGLGGIAVNPWTVFEPDDPYDVKRVDNGTNIGLHIDFRIGGGFKGDKFKLYFWGVGNWFIIETYDPYPLEIYLPISGIAGLGVSYYFKTTSPSLYINAGIGYSIWHISNVGYGAMGGIGYEFTRHWSVECGVMWGIAWELSSQVNFLAITLGIIGIAY